MGPVCAHDISAAAEPFSPDDVQVSLLIASPSTTPRPGRVLVVMCAGMFLVLLDVTAVNVALPSIGATLDTGTAGLRVGVPPPVRA